MNILKNSYCRQDIVGNGEPFEIVFVSSDKSAEELMSYMKVWIIEVRRQHDVLFEFVARRPTFYTYGMNA